MAARAVHTLIFLGAHRTDRVDLGRAPGYELVSQQHQVSHGSDDPVSRTEAILKSSPKAGKLVWVIWEGASAQMLDMPTGVITGLERDQLGDSLSYEAEPLSGIPASESAIDGIPQRNLPGALPDYRRFWVTQVPSSINDRLEEVVVAAGAKLSGIAHPGGLPRENWDSAAPLAGNAEWRRIEIWDQLTFSLQGRTDGTVETRVIRALPRSESWSAELPLNGPLSWMGPWPVTRVGPDGRRGADSIPPVGPDGVALEPIKIDFPADSAPVDWLRAWVRELTAQPRRVPAVHTHSHVSPNRKFYVSGGLAAALALTLCAGHATWIGFKAAEAKTRADHVAAMRMQFAPKDDSAKEVQRLTPQTESLKAELLELDARHTTLATECDRRQKLVATIAAHKQGIDAALAVHRSAVAELMTALADSEAISKNGDLVIKEVRKQDSGELELTGLSRQAVFADSVATRLEQRLKAGGWKVGAAQKRLRDDSQAFDFSIVLTPTVLSDLPASDVPGSTTRPTTRPGARPSASPIAGPRTDGPRTAAAQPSGGRFP